MKNNCAYGSLAPFLPLSEISMPLDLRTAFGRVAPLEVEIGFGTGEYLTRLAQDMPETNFLGFEQCARRILSTLRKLHHVGAGHVRVMRLDAVYGLRFLVPQRALNRVHCLFPCPWPKKRHAKHRLFSVEVLKLINSRLVDGAELYIVTDQAPYAAWIKEHLPDTGFGLASAVIPAMYGTKFERKWAQAGQSCFHELRLVKQTHKDVPQGGVAMRAYVVDDVDLAALRPLDTWGPVTIKFGEVLVDLKAGKAMVDAVVSEDGRAQHLWIGVTRKSQGWTVAPAAGTVVLPTDGAQQAVARVADAARDSKGH